MVTKRESPSAKTVTSVKTVKPRAKKTAASERKDGPGMVVLESEAASAATYRHLAAWLRYTEAQWKEYAGGQEFKDLPHGGVTGRSEPLIVGESGPANKFGLFDVLGNVWEWCLDGATGEEKLLKGGAFNSINYDRTLLPDRQASNCGFRCVLIPQ